jgi:hypothetical protein
MLHSIIFTFISKIIIIFYIKLRSSWDDNGGVVSSSSSSSSSSAALYLLSSLYCSKWINDIYTSNFSISYKCTFTTINRSFHYIIKSCTCTMEISKYLKGYNESEQPLNNHHLNIPNKGPPRLMSPSPPSFIMFMCIVSVLFCSGLHIVSGCETSGERMTAVVVSNLRLCFLFLLLLLLLVLCVSVVVVVQFWSLSVDGVKE